VPPRAPYVFEVLRFFKEV